MTGHDQIEREMKKVGRLRTICEVHRQIHRELKKAPIDREKVQALVREAFDMGKKMDNKLQQYKHNYSEGWWKINRLAGGELEDGP